MKLAGNPGTPLTTGRPPASLLRTLFEQQETAILMALFVLTALFYWRNDAMLDVLPVGVLVFPGNGIQENLADKARKLGIPVLKFERGA